MEEVFVVFVLVNVLDVKLSFVLSFVGLHIFHHFLQTGETSLREGLELGPVLNECATEVFLFNFSKGRNHGGPEDWSLVEVEVEPSRLLALNGARLWDSNLFFVLFGRIDQFLLHHCLVFVFFLGDHRNIIVYFLGLHLDGFFFSNESDFWVME